MNRLMELEDSKIPLLAGTALVAAALTVHTLRQSKDTRRYRKIERPESTLPVLGNLLDVVRREDDFHDWFLEQTVRYEGRPWAFTLPIQGEAIVVSTPEAIEEVMSTQFKNFIKGQFQRDLLSGLFAMGVGLLDGEQWYHQRKTAVKFFSTKVLDMFVRESIKKNIGRVNNVMEQAIQSQEMIDLKALFYEFTLDTFVEMGLGVDLASIGSNTTHPIQEALEIISSIVFERIRRPGWKIERWLNVGKEGERTRQMDMVYAWIHEVIQKSVDKSIQKKHSGEDASQRSCKSIVELFLDSVDEDVGGLSKDDFVDFVLNLVVAARDTTADTLTWIFYCLNRYPEVEKKLREELDMEFADLPRDNSTYLSMDRLKSLVYLEAVVKETIRLYPVGALTFREAVEDTVICGDIFVRKGQQVMTSQYSIARSPELWGPDASEFRPERWIDPETGKIKPVSPFKFFNFSAGPRICIGMNLALMELRIVTANLLYRCRFEVDPSVDGTYKAGVTLTTKQPLRAKVVNV
ncbi:hypothetical protein Poli38472_008249 [Pythium oligandrum]|uniref:Cytochrome P450 n=1 Tax=Pythium oligandrum TaxID=41045 RepID=A0A8K1CNF8_PYTOL|nr:hypothetical protein Poli38472_008249 [Pythium oligandrum]|eukprot:TMW65607.1 hypothetical protein Poli38472_008249 [Pythium oligandrum]